MAKTIPQSLKDQYPDIPWSSIAKTRNQLIDEYFRVDLQMLWDTVQIDIPFLKTAIAQVLEDLTSES